MVKIMKINENDRIKKIRETIGITQEQMAKSIGVSKQYFSRVEKGITDLSKEKAIILCSTYKVSLDWLLNNLGSMFIDDENIQTSILDNIDEFNKILNIYNLYLKNIFNIVDEKYPDANIEDKLTTASILFNQDCISEKITYTKFDAVKNKIEKTKKSAEDFEIKVLSTYYFVKTQKK